MKTMKVTNCASTKTWDRHIFQYSWPAGRNR